MHTDYVDCVQFVGGLILSKSIANTLALWKPQIYSSRKTTTTNILLQHNNNNNNNKRLRNSAALPLRDFALTHCGVWFVRFQTDRAGRMLAIGNTKGDIKIWEVGTHKNPFATLSNAQCTSTIRMVSFSPDGKSIIATCDDSTVWKWDAY
eukprot:CAMPEP_0197826390 /NCGR_PEP_ID=MMETSP1437-20131217/3354_1 /TAXON_ID=49252 ORGANISM="Eucampia antarctica, Strain CCMP1452" /NCGR_SAMPLE_ID=MMETSP1437 /ASSEMBLY_ACC=CAM_ASM_001096 /LENGTH=149 /DNA_ID=CAMNT_0043426809 /DNA_START=598 /DNA_END=1047 /DNA_ORIENTATION=+